MTSQSKINSELNRIAKTVKLIEHYQKQPVWNEAETSGISNFLANIYGGYERILTIILEDKGIRLPKSESWHFNLLVKSVENNIVPIELKETFSGLLSYRHFHIHGYGFEIKEGWLRENAVEVVNTFPAFVKHINDLLADIVQ